MVLINAKEYKMQLGSCPNLEKIISINIHFLYNNVLSPVGFQKGKSSLWAMKVVKAL